MPEKIYCGPILRNVNSTAVNIWLVMQGDFVHLNGSILGLLVDNKCDKVQVAAHLFAYMITITPSSGQFPENCLLHYDLTLNGESLLDNGSLSYDQQHKLPSFVIGAPAPFLSGSCRKAHSPTDDMLVYADTLLKQSWRYPEERHKALFLSGDQIYADDVHEDFLQAAVTCGQILFGKDHVEHFPKSAGNEVVSLKIGSPGDNDFRRWYDFGDWEREHFIKDIGMTSAKADKHLVLFSEYVATYLLYWSHEAWHDVFAANPKLLESKTITAFVKGL